MTTMKRRADAMKRAVERQTTDYARMVEVKRARREMMRFYAIQGATIVCVGLVLWWFL